MPTGLGCREAPAGVEPASAVLQTAARPSGPGALRASALHWRAMSSPGIEPGPRPSQSRVRVRHTPRTSIEKRPSEEPPTRESNPALRLRRPPCIRHTRGEAVECPRQESNPVFDLRKVACCPSHAEGPVEADGRARTGMNLLTRQGPHRSATSAGAGAQGFEPCPRVLEARCSPRSTPLSWSGARVFGGS